IRPLDLPIAPEGGTVILTGNLCPDGAVLKQSAASAHLLTHRGRAVVFEDHADLHARIDDPSLPVDETSVLVLKRVGPNGAPGEPDSTRGYGKLFLDHVLQANEGVDFDFLRGKAPVRFEDSAGPSHA